jgi:hypothetical protein
VNRQQFPVLHMLLTQAVMALQPNRQDMDDPMELVWIGSEELACERCTDTQLCVACMVTQIRTERIECK